MRGDPGDDLHDPAISVITCYVRSRRSKLPPDTRTVCGRNLSTCGRPAGQYGLGVGVLAQDHANDKRRKFGPLCNGPAMAMAERRV